ncbi:MAG: hypothetical protein J7639_13320 [Paenibacillaceae bacterium]|nr:hypothetical protein [Paenibacillaceae bacterium]
MWEQIDASYHSNAIEGNTFSYQETAFFLREGLTIKGKSLREHLEIVNHAEAIHYLQEGIAERELSLLLPSRSARDGKPDSLTPRGKQSLAPYSAGCCFSSQICCHTPLY